jgi:hypothetical protein
MDQWELFDLKNDKDELNNLYDIDEYKEVVSDLKIRLKELQTEYKDDMPLEDMRKMTRLRIKRVYNE